MGTSSGNQGKRGSQGGAGADSQGAAVKEEPKEFVEEEEVDAEAQDAEDFGDYGGGNEEDYIGPGGDGLYGDEGDYIGGDPEQEGMDIEYFCQYKERDEFDSRVGGMFQGEYGEEDPGLEEEYEEQA